MRLHAQDRSFLGETNGLVVLLTVSLLIFAGRPAHAAFPHHDARSIHKQVEALEMQWREAQLNNNVSDMDHLLADDYVGISANGTIESKAQALAVRQAGTLHIKQLELSDLKVRLYGDTAVVTSRAELQGSNGQRDISGTYRYTRVYTRRLGQWKIVSFEASRIHDEAERAKR